ncbi:MAG: hypothetical protein FWG05_01250 [Kiritimatiellaeota bacterium]|nr:hypothetical protein [Kiritimatiellota bacterium]
MRKPAKQNGSEHDTIVISRRISLFRNLASAVFPERAPSDEARAVREKVVAACADLLKKSGGGTLSETARDDAGWIERMAVYERLHDGDPADDKRGEVVFLDAYGLPDIIVNSSDHVEISVDCAGVSFADAFTAAGKIADELGKRLNFANGEPFGWLSADPEHAGVGMRVSQSFCFGALLILRELDAVLRGVERIGFDIVPVYGDNGPDAQHHELAPGSCYRISPVPYDGMDAAALAAKAERVFGALVEIEKNARLALFADHVSRDMLEDYVMRAVGVGAGARTVSETEYIDLYVALAFAVDMGVLKEARPPDDRKSLVGFFNDSVALFSLQQAMTRSSDFDDDHADFLRRRFLADLCRRDFSRFIPEWSDRVSDGMNDLFGMMIPGGKTKKRK